MNVERNGEVDLVRFFDGDREVAQIAIDAFREHVGEMMARIESSLDPFDADELAEAVHSLKGAVSHFPATSLYESLAELERSRTLSDARARLEMARQKLAEFEKRLVLVE